jgi:hypothetical protein
MAFLDKLSETDACPPAGAGFGETVMEFRASIMHGSVFTCWGELGGVAHGTFTKSKNSVMSGCAASRAVKLGKLNRVSMNFKMAV